MKKKTEAQEPKEDSVKKYGILALKIVITLVLLRIFWNVLEYQALYF